MKHRNNFDSWWHLNDSTYHSPLFIFSSSFIYFLSPTTIRAPLVLIVPRRLLTPPSHPTPQKSTMLIGIERMLYWGFGFVSWISIGTVRDLWDILYYPFILSLTDCQVPCLRPYLQRLELIHTFVDNLFRESLRNKEVHQLITCLLSLHCVERTVTRVVKDMKTAPDFRNSPVALSK